MDVLSSQATVAGYKAVLLGASTLPRLLPMMTTAAGSLTPGKAFVLGAGVAGLQAIATARRLGAVVSAIDVRPAVKEQVQSLGASFVAASAIDAGAEGQGGYAGADRGRAGPDQGGAGRPHQGHGPGDFHGRDSGKRAPVLITRSDGRVDEGPAA